MFLELDTWAVRSSFVSIAGPLSALPERQDRRYTIPRDPFFLAYAFHITATLRVALVSTTRMFPSHVLEFGVKVKSMSLTRRRISTQQQEFS